MKTWISRTAIPRGFRFAATACGLKRQGLDLALLTSEAPAAAAAVFTTNVVQAAPVRLSREHLRRSRGRMRAIVVNSGNANCSTGPAGMVAARRTAECVAAQLGCRPEEVLVCSTGVIGVPLRVERILQALPGLARKLSNRRRSFHQVTRAILTTDTQPKWASATFHLARSRVHILGCAKGAGMIHPQMATMLAFLVTNARIAPGLLARTLRAAVHGTFNAITVDGDTSTNDTVAVLATGASGARVIRAGSADFRRFGHALEAVCHKLALAIVADGEGAQRVVEVEVRGARSKRDADRVARAIANSPLVKTALAGADPNWGRILAAAGRAGVPFDPEQAKVWLARIPVYARGRALPFDERVAHREMRAGYVPIAVDLGVRRGKGGARNGKQEPGRARIWTCDFTSAYVNINADYRT